MVRSEIKALTFDVGGSIFDWQTPIRAHVAQLAKDRDAKVDDKAFAWDWRRRMFEMLTEVRHGDRPMQNADALHRAALDELADQYPMLALSPADRDEMTDIWHAMGVWDDVPQALERLREHYRTVVLTVLSLAIAVDSSKHAGISWDTILSCEFLNRYKPEPESYQHAAQLLRASPNEVMMVAVHPGDLAAAQAAGMKTAYVEPKLEEMGSRGDTAGFDVRATSYTDLADQLC